MYIYLDGPKDIDLIKHEFGHILQAKQLGNNFFYKVIAPASLASAARQDYDKYYEHKTFWTETSANYLSWEYFGFGYWNNEDYPINGYIGPKKK